MIADRLHFTGVEAADRLLVEDPFALLIGFALDQRVPVPKAFMGPWVLRERLGSLSPAVVAEADLEPMFRQVPAIHRFPAMMAKQVHALAVHVVVRVRRRRRARVDDGGLLRRAAREHRRAPRLREDEGQGPGSVLFKRFDVALAEPLVPWHPTLGDVDSAEALANYQASKKANKALWEA